MTDLKPDAYAYAVNLLMSLRDKHIPEADELEPLEDVLGVLTQIDNLTTALTRAEPKEVDALQATLQAIRGQAYAATNPANRKNESVEDRCAFYEKTLDEIADQNHEIDILERQYEWYMAEIEKARAAPKRVNTPCRKCGWPNHGEYSKCNRCCLPVTPETET